MYIITNSCKDFGEINDRGRTVEIIAWEIATVFHTTTSLTFPFFGTRASIKADSVEGTISSALIMKSSLGG